MTVRFNACDMFTKQESWLLLTLAAAGMYAHTDISFYYSLIFTDLAYHQLMMSVHIIEHFCWCISLYEICLQIICMSAI